MMRALRYAAALTRRGYWWLKRRQLLVDFPTQEARLDRCAPCEHNVDGVCGLCGCPLMVKTAWASEQCPKKFWTRQKLPINKAQAVPNYTTES